MRNCDVARMESRGEGRKCGLSTLEKNFPKTVEKKFERWSRVGFGNRLRSRSGSCGFGATRASNSDRSADLQDHELGL